MSKKAKIILLIVIIAALFLLSNPRFYNGLNMGIAWDWGGVEFRGDPGLFICEWNYNSASNARWHNPLSDMFPGLVVDC